MAAKTIKQPRRVAHCGECLHWLVTDGRHMWCCNERCPQMLEKFLKESWIDVRPAPSPQAA